MAKEPDRDEEGEESPESPFINTPSELDELTHAELRLMYEHSSRAVLFAKNIQWWSVGSSLLVFGALIAIAFFGSKDRSLVELLGLLTIVLACGVIFVLVMYQSWQFNEISRIVEIEKHFSSQYRKIRDLKSKREGNFHRYTLLVFMSIVVILGAVVANIVISKML